jgi:hypothetical protein
MRIREAAAAAVAAGDAPAATVATAGEAAATAWVATGEAAATAVASAGCAAVATALTAAPTVGEAGVGEGVQAPNTMRVVVPSMSFARYRLTFRPFTLVRVHGGSLTAIE